MLKRPVSVQRRVMSPLARCYLGPIVLQTFLLILRLLCLHLSRHQEADIAFQEEPSSPSVTATCLKHESRCTLLPILVTTTRKNATCEKIGHVKQNCKFTGEVSGLIRTIHRNILPIDSQHAPKLQLRNSANARANICYPFSPLSTRYHFGTVPLYFLFLDPDPAPKASRNLIVLQYGSCRSRPQG